mgnify:FL=1
MNLLEEYGYSAAQIDERIEQTWKTLFEGNKAQRIYFEAADETGYIYETLFDDVRTESMGFGMMMCVQMDKQQIFDRLWKWTRTYMYISEGELKGYFRFACHTDGTEKYKNPRPDGEETIAAALLFAAHRWGSKDGIFDYEKQAFEILHNVIHSKKPLWNKENFLIKNKIDEDLSDISYNMPHLYELFAMFADTADADFWSTAAAASREFIVRCCNKKTGMSPEYVKYNGMPAPLKNHGSYFTHSYIVASNISLYTLWFGDSPDFETIARNLINFFDKKQVSDFMDYKIDGTPRRRHSRHPVALCSAIAQAAIVLERRRTPIENEMREKARAAVERFWNTPLRNGKHRYYDNTQYLLSLLILSGKYMVY